MSTTKITKEKNPWTLDLKRFNPPHEISSTCPKCSTPYDQEMRFAYPKINKEQDYTLYCSECDHEWKVKIIIELKIKLIPDNP